VASQSRSRPGPDAKPDLTRVISGALLLAGVVAAIWLLPPIAVLAIAVFVSLLAFREYVDLAARGGTRVSLPAGGTAVALACVAVGMPGLPVEAAIAGTTLGLSALALGSATKTATGEQSADALRTAAIAAFAPLYIGVPLGLLSATRWMLGREAALLLILTVAVSDSFQYYSGRMFGRRPLAPLVSPKKTVEGAVGGFVGAALAVGIVGHWWLPQMAIPARIVLGLAIAAVGIVGDLFESTLKRSVGMKDASAMIPGHGGVLDRIDALIFATPVFYVFVRYSF
jgi:phosphatidate cytidylyltransferase